MLASGPLFMQVECRAGLTAGQPYWVSIGMDHMMGGQAGEASGIAQVDAVLNVLLEFGRTDFERTSLALTVVPAVRGMQFEVEVIEDGAWASRGSSPHLGLCRDGSSCLIVLDALTVWLAK